MDIYSPLNAALADGPFRIPANKRISIGDYRLRTSGVLAGRVVTRGAERVMEFDEPLPEVVGVCKAGIKWIAIDAANTATIAADTVIGEQRKKIQM